MVRQRGLPFQLLMTLRVALLILALTTAFLWYVLGQVQQRIEQSGRENFGLLVQSAFSNLDALVQSYTNYLDTTTAMLPAVKDLFAEPVVNALAGSFVRLKGATVMTVGQPDNSKLYFLKQDMEAPPGTAYTMGHYHVGANGTGQVEESYHASDYKVISTRKVTVTLLSSKSPWFRGAQESGHFFISSAHPVQGRDTFNVTLAAKSQDRVVALAVPLEQFDQLLRAIPLSRNGAAILIDDQLRVIGFHANGTHWNNLHIRGLRMQPLTRVNHPVLAAAERATSTLAENQVSLVDLAGQKFLLAWHDMLKVPGTRYRILLLSPLEDLSQIAKGAQRDAWIVVFVGLGVLLPFTWISSGAMARVLQNLVRQSQRIGQMDFGTNEKPVDSSVKEVLALGQAHETMRGALAGRTLALQRVSRHLERLIDIGIHLAEEKDQKALLRKVLVAAGEMSGATMGVIFLRDDKGMLRAAEFMGLPPMASTPEFDLNHPEKDPDSMAVRTALSGVTQVSKNILEDPRAGMDRSRKLAKAVGVEVRSAVSLAMRPDEKPAVGVMQLYNATDPDSGKICPFTESQISYLESLARQAAVVLEHQKLVASQDDMLDTLVRTLGEAIDAKSEFTGRHCVRVPELAMMIAQEAQNVSSGPLAGFSFKTDDQWREFRTGAWLHDCGKITTPEHLLDKATKLETVYNRLHEIRTRFEVLLRDVRIEALQARIDGRMDAQAAAHFCDQRLQQLREEYAFVAQCNIGSEGMAIADVDRLRSLSERRWLRHFDDQLGLSWIETELRPKDQSRSLPASEPLIADKPWHLIPRSAQLQRDLTEGFSMEVPEYLYNNGELYSLSVLRGTLTAEERFKINEHIIHTLRMLEGAQFPSHLQRVPEYAGTHHETMDGHGYPRGLNAEELSIPARIMSIADIFEALTAADRPYKTPKPLSESLRILQGLKNKGKIDPDLFALFLKSGVYLRYAERFLQPEQIDVKDISPYLD